MSPAMLSLIVCALLALFLTTLLDVQELRHLKIQRAHQRGRRYTPPITLVITGSDADQLIRSIEALQAETYPALNILAIIAVARTTSDFRAVARTAKASPHPVRIASNTRRSAVANLLPRYISNGLVLVLPATYRLVPGSLFVATGYFRDPRLGHLALTSRAAVPRHLGSALSAVYRLVAPTPHRYSTPFAPGILTRMHRRASPQTEQMLLPALTLTATAAHLPFLIALASLTIPSLILLSAFTNPRELPLTLVCIAGPFVYLGLRASHLLGLPFLSRLSVAFLTPFAAALASIYWALAHLDKHRA